MIVSALHDAGDYARYYALQSDDELSIQTIFWSEDEIQACTVEKNKRRSLKKQEQQRIAAALKERIKQRKEALPFSDAISTEICERIGSGELLTVICLDEHMPTVRRCNRWLRQSVEFKALFDESINDRLNVFEEDIIRISDDAAKDVEEVKSKGGTRRVLDPAKVTAAKLRIEVRRLHLKAARPSKWGESTTIVTKSEDGLDPASLSTEELERRIAELEEKERTVREVA